MAATARISRLLPGDPDTVRLLELRNIYMAADLFKRTDTELLDLLDLHLPRVRAIRASVAAAMTPAPRTTLDLLDEAAQRSRFLRIGMPALEQAMRGGVPAGGITELVGPAGMGKTQLCLQAALLAAVPDSLGGLGGAVVYFDTERKFSSARLKQMALERFPGRFGPGRDAALEEVMQRILVANPANSRDLLRRIEDLQGTIIDRDVKLIILDSVAIFARTEYGRDSVQERQRNLGQQAAALKHLAESFRIPVLVTNQVTTAIGPSATHGVASGVVPDAAQAGGRLTAALGAQWAHAVNTRLVLEHTAGARWVRVAKSPMCAAVAVPYEIKGGGVVEYEGVEAQHVRQGDVLAMGIEHDLNYHQK
ncbi:unnamed protein product [Pedinophyceae sp. YPF-701]|nr:unnamed protein product [Pedinophyceae sp. YPF-701]